MAAAPDEDRKAAPPGAAVERVVVRTRPVPVQRNRMLAVLLASVVALVLLTAVTLVALVHYAEIRHTLPGA